MKNSKALKLLQKILPIFIIFLNPNQISAHSLVISSNIDMAYYREFVSGQDSINWWTRLYPNLRFSQDEHQAIFNYTFNYTFGHYFVINNKLRDGKGIASLNAQEKQMLMTLDRALSKTVIFENFKVYRYETLKFLTRLIDKDIFFKDVYVNNSFQKDTAEAHLNTLIDKNYKDYGFMSTTMIRNSVFYTRPIELVIKVPRLADATYVSIPGFAVFQSQYELLFPRNRILTIEGYEISQDRKKVTIYTKMRGSCYFKDPCLEPHIDNLK